MITSTFSLDGWAVESTAIDARIMADNVALCQIMISLELHLGIAVIFMLVLFCQQIIFMRKDCRVETQQFRFSTTL